MLGRINWCGQCQQMADELVALIRHRIFQFAEEKPLYFSIR
jgi:bacterioferritin-associated ferredoxin